MRSTFVLVLLLMGFCGFAQTQEFARQTTDRDSAMALYNAGKFEQALVLFEEIYKKTQDEYAYGYILNCQKALKNYAEAEKVISKRLKKVKDPKLLIDLGYYQQLQKKDAEARNNYNAALQEIVKNPGLAYTLSEQFSKYALYPEALQAYVIAEQNHPGLAFHFQKGLIYAEMGDVDKMYQEYLMLIEQSPSYYMNVRERIARNITDDPSNKTNEILKTQLIKKIQETQNVLYTQLLVWLYVEEAQYDKALRQLKALDKRNENVDQDLFTLGQKASENGAYTVAIDGFSYLLAKGEINPFYEDAQVSLLKTKRLLLQSDPTTPTTAYANLAKEHATAGKIVAGSARFVLIMNDLSEILFFNLAKPDSAINTLNRTIARYEKTYKKPVAESKMLLGDFLLAQGHSVDAIFKYMEVDRAFPESTLGDEAKFKKGMVAYYTFDFKWALDQFEVLKSSSTKLISNDALEMALLISDNSVEDTLYQGLTYYARADLYFYRNMPDSALKSLDLLLTIFPEHAIKEEAMLLQGRIYYQKGAYAMAVTTLQKMLANGGGDIWADDALMLLASIYENRLGDTENAMLAYEKILFDHPGSTFVPEARRKYRALRGDKLN